MTSYSIPVLPLDSSIETIAILKKTISANKVLAELKGIALTIPNQGILINTLSLQESKDSSEIENIVTTHDELFQASYKQEDISPAAKEVGRYIEAVSFGFQSFQTTKLITNNLLIDIGKILTPSVQSFRKMPGTALVNQSTKETIYTPPQNKDEIEKYMKNLEAFINDNSLSSFDPLVKMAIIHHQFESIHPFHDGNGRTGRILNILYLISQEVLNIPILYLSRYITKNKNEYYRLLQKVREEGEWEEWILYMLDALESTARQTIETINSIKNLMAEYKILIKKESENLYSHELINTIFSHPYTKIEFLVSATGVSRQTASKNLKKLVELGILKLERHKNINYFINTKLVNLFTHL